MTLKERKVRHNGTLYVIKITNSGDLLISPQNTDLAADYTDEYSGKLADRHTLDKVEHDIRNEKIFPYHEESLLDFLQDDRKL